MWQGKWNKFTSFEHFSFSDDAVLQTENGKGGMREENLQEEQLLKQSISLILPGLLCRHVPTILNHCESFGHFKPFHNRMIAQILSSNPVTSTEGLSHSSQFQTLQFSSIYHHTQFEINWHKLVLKVYFLKYINGLFFFAYQLPETHLAWVWTTQQVVVAAHLLSSKLTEKSARKCKPGSVSWCHVNKQLTLCHCNSNS